MNVGDIRELIKDLDDDMEVIHYDPQDTKAYHNPNHPRPDCWGIDATEARVRPMVCIDGHDANEYLFNDRMPAHEYDTLDTFKREGNVIFLKAKDILEDHDVQLALVIQTSPGGC